MTVTSDGQAIDPSDVRLVAGGRGHPGGAIEWASGAWGDVVTVTSTPDDAEAVQRYLIEALRRALVPDSERAVGDGRDWRDSRDGQDGGDEGVTTPARPISSIGIP